jgi:adenosylcobyric acid synthase
MKYAKTIMIQGTGSGVGKSIITAALCRIFVQDGYAVAPFKAQNMALNSFVTVSGGEIGRAQAVQAQAAKITATVDMNPVLIKPSSDMCAQIVVEGKPLGNKSAAQYMRYKKKLFSTACGCLKRLRTQFEIVVLEGAGSPAEVNLRKNDIVNMSIAQASRTPVILVGDIDKGGVLAWIVGTLDLLTSAERKHVKGIIINKFRGDLSLFEDGIRFLEARTGIKVLGVLPYFKDINIPEEDAVPLERMHAHKTSRKDIITIAVVCLPHISNFTDFDALEKERDVELRYVRSADELGAPDIIIIPGTKNTINDLLWMNAAGISEKLLAHATHSQSVIIGICGGYQMLGETICDPAGIESRKAIMSGLGLLPVRTTLLAEKQLHQVAAEEIVSGLSVQGYEIHHGSTKFTGRCNPVFNVKQGSGEGKTDGASSRDNTIWGTYIHGVFDNDAFRRNFLNRIRDRKGLKPCAVTRFCPDKEFDKLATIVRKNLDIQTLYSILAGNTPTIVKNPSTRYHRKREKVARTHSKARPIQS